MDIKLFNQPTLRDALSYLNTDTPNWWSWIDPENGEVYSNVQSIIDGVDVPSETVVNAKLTELQNVWNADNADYVLNRKSEYKSIKEQLDMQYWDLVNGTTTWKDHIAEVKANNPKPL